MKQRTAVSIQRDIAFLKRQLSGEPEQLEKALAPLQQEWAQLMGQLSLPLDQQQASEDAPKGKPEAHQAPVNRAFPASPKRRR